MSICPVCDLDVSGDKVICDQCGYDFNLKEIADSSKLKGLLDKHDRMGRWPEEVLIKKRVYEIQIQKHGKASTTPNQGWSIRKTAQLIDESHPTTSQDILLAKEIQNYPELLQCKKKTLAKKRLRVIQKSIHEPRPFEY